MNWPRLTHNIVNFILMFVVIRWIRSDVRKRTWQFGILMVIVLVMLSLSCGYYGLWWWE